MLERFKVPDDIAVRVDQAVMRQAVEDIFKVFDMPEAEAEASADVLLYADIRGINSHGVSNMMRAYVAGFRAAQINPTPLARRERDTLGAISYDCDNGLGIAQSRVFMEKPANGPKTPESRWLRRTTDNITARRRTTHTWRWPTT
jgi:LDH2 family malate/lactate/ureidoglycolate dehydrogenase